MKALFYRFSRFLLKLIARPTLTGAENAAAVGDAELVYVLHHRSTTDLVMLDLICEQHAITSPFQRLPLGDHDEAQRMFPLLRSAAGRITMQSHSSRLLRLIDAPEPSKQAIQLMPVTVFWGRGKSGQDSLFGNLTSEDWAVTGRFKRLLNLFINRRNIVVHIGRAIPLMEVADPDTEAAIAVRRTARLLRVRLRQQKVTALGPDYSHRRTLLSQVVSSRAVRSCIDTNVANGATRKKQERLALKYAQTIASDMSHPTVRVLARLLRWFWTRIYDGITTRGLERLEAISATHTLVYVPSHRSHVDYLLLSYLLYFRSFMIPHIAAGDNLNQPILGGILR
ncbi:MAG: 1-acyl-sn-glycerol-3-phosphate acyltransferase, partial [Pseudomonadota bacterium]